MYIPRTAEAGAYLVVLTVPDGRDTVAWLAASGWLATADRYNFCLYVLEPVARKWGTPAEEMRYISEAYANIAATRGKHYLTMPTSYLVGYGAGGQALQMFAMKNSITVAAAAFIDASDIDQAYLRQMETGRYAKTDIAFSDVPMPVLILSANISGNTAAVVEYWEKANAVADNPADFNGGKIFYQQKGSRPQFTPASVSSVAVLDGRGGADNDAALPKLIYTQFLARYTRYGGFAGGNTLGSRPDQHALGVQVKKLIVGGRTREYLVYVPKTVRESGNAAPVLFYFPGSQQTHKMIFDITRLWEVADDGKFILVIGEAVADPNNPIWPAWDITKDRGKNYDLPFVEALVKQVDRDYRVDASRRYISGHSNGAMFAFLVGMNLSEYFAAMAPTSGAYFSARMGTFDVLNDAPRSAPLPYWLIFGEYDIWPYDVNKNKDVKLTLEYWLDRNGAGTLGDYAVSKTGRFMTYEWKNAADIPLVRYTVTMNRGHSILPQEMKLIWQWLSQWRKDITGNLVYTPAPGR
jgi:Poly(3-hydroxybutyrate) depolymerase